MSDALKLMIHAPTEAAFERARRNLLNVLHNAPDASVELVVNAQGVSAAIQHYRGYKAHLVRCANSLTAQNLEAPEGVRVVPNAMLYLAQQQAGGWAYIRA